MTLLIFWKKKNCSSNQVFIIFFSTGLITVTMLKEVFVLGCLLSLALAQPVSETFSFSVSTQVSLYVDTVTVKVIV